MQLRASTCWIQRSADFASQTVEPVDHSDSVSLNSSCRISCYQTDSCTDYYVSGEQCFHMGGVCDQDQCAVPNQAVHTKIKNCGERSSCTKLNDTAFWWISGVYCPMAESTRGPVYLRKARQFKTPFIFQSTISHGTGRRTVAAEKCMPSSMPHLGRTLMTPLQITSSCMVLP